MNVQAHEGERWNESRMARLVVTPSIAMFASLGKLASEIILDALNPRFRTQTDRNSRTQFLSYLSRAEVNTNVLGFASFPGATKQQNGGRLDFYYY